MENLFMEEKKEVDLEQELTDRIVEHNQQLSRDSLFAVFRILYEAKVWVPVKVSIKEEGEEASVLDVTEIKAMEEHLRLEPDVLKNEEGTLFFPVFSQREEAPEEYQNSFSWVVYPFLNCCQQVLRSDKWDAVVVNAFSKTFVVTEEMIKHLLSNTVEVHRLQKGTALEISSVEMEAEELKEAATRFLQRNKEVKKAYLAKMNQNHEDSYVFVLDMPKENSNPFFASMYQEIEEIQTELPVDFVLYPCLGEYLEAISCEPFYTQE